MKKLIGGCAVANVVAPEEMAENKKSCSALGVFFFIEECVANNGRGGGWNCWRDL